MKHTTTKIFVKYNYIISRSHIKGLVDKVELSNYYCSKLKKKEGNESYYTRCESRKRNTSILKLRHFRLHSLKTLNSPLQRREIIRRLYHPSIFKYMLRVLIYLLFSKEQSTEIEIVECHWRQAPSKGWRQLVT